MDSRRYIDGPAYGTPTEKPTGLLTRFVPDKLKHTAFYRLFLRLTRLLQFISSVVSLGIFSQRLFKVYRLVNSIKTRRGVNAATGAVEGILAAAVLYTILATIMSLSLKGRGPRWLRWLWVLLDLLFVAAFIAVAVLTRPNGGHAGPRHCYGERDVSGQDNVTGNVSTGDDTCDLPWGTFVLAIASTILHAITAAFHEVRRHYNQNRHSTMSEAPMVEGHQGYNGATGNGTHQAYNGRNGAGEYVPAGARTGPARV